MNRYFISCDWGTTSLRLKLVDSESITVIDEIFSSNGIAKVYDEWKLKGKEDFKERKEFYFDFLEEPILELFTKNSISLDEAYVVISGMASSSIGIMELDYAEVPFCLNGKTGVKKEFLKLGDLELTIILISGVKTEGEVMRGEEVQLVGLKQDLVRFGIGHDVMVLLPGTHSKHVYIKENKIINFDTYITGEIFALMRQNGLLKEAVQPQKEPLSSADWGYFKEGVLTSTDQELLKSLFKVRTNKLFEKMTKTQNYFFLSGVLIGAELFGLRFKKITNILLCSDNGLFDYYSTALKVLEIESNIFYVGPDKASLCAIKGQLSIASMN